MSVILGPVPCNGCRRLVWWDGWRWFDRSGKHYCRGAKA